MTAYTLTQLEALSGQQGTGYDTSRYHNGVNTSRTTPLAAVGIRQRIYDVLIQSKGAAMTRGDIARTLGLKKTPWIIGHIDQLVSDGYLQRAVGSWRNGAPVYWYFAN